MKRTYDYEELARQVRHIVKNEKVYRQMNYSREDLAKRLDVPNYIVSKLMKTKMNYSLLDYLNLHRVKYAHSILTAPRVNRHTVEEVSEMAGFTCRMTFYRAYWKFYGYAPGQERKNAQEKAENEAE